jgi:ADP-ribose pyrophosphatase
MDLKLLNRRRIYDGRVFSTIVDDVEYPSGNRSIREVAEHGGGAVAFAVFPDETILLVRQQRYPIGDVLWELPAGKLDPGEDPLDCARRELEEETGYSAAQWQKLTAIYTTPGFCNERLHIYLARELTKHPDGRRLEEGELTMTVSILPVADAIAMIERQEIVDGKSICGILLGERMLRRKGANHD